jgi:glycosyltransferase involved in cell wall biosynthesis
MLMSGECLTRNFEYKTSGSFKKLIPAPMKNGVVDLSRYDLLWKKLKRVKTDTQKHFVVIIPSYNNSTRYKRNLDSIFMQKYENYHIIYIDDCSPDGTGDLVEKYIKEKKQEQRVILIKNRERRKAMANIYMAVNMCDDFDIIASCDGDDWWSNDHVLLMLNKIYNDPEVWMTYGSLMHWPENLIRMQKRYPNDVIEKNMFRRFGWNSSGLRSYYAWLFKKIKVEDLMRNGKFVESGSDYSMLYPMFEMAGFRHKYIPDVLYIADRATGLNDFAVDKELQKKILHTVLFKEKYTPLKENPLLNKKT